MQQHQQTFSLHGKFVQKELEDMMNEIIDLHLKGEYEVPKVKVVSDNEYYFINNTYFDCEDNK